MATPENNTLNFNEDANNSFSSEQAAKILLEQRLNVKIDIVAWQHEKYDLIISEWNKNFPKWTTIDVKANFNRWSKIIFLEVINNGRNDALKENDYNVETIVKSDYVKSWWWSFLENMAKTDYILFFDKEWQHKTARGKREAYLIPRKDILANNNETNIKAWKWKVKWNKISVRWDSRWRSAYIITPLAKYQNRIYFQF